MEKWSSTKSPNAPLSNRHSLKSQNWSLRSLTRALNQTESEVQQFVADTMEGDNNMPSYRPISLTSSLYKIMETVVLARLQAYTE